MVDDVGTGVGGVDARHVAHGDGGRRQGFARAAISHDTFHADVALSNTDLLTPPTSY